MKNIEAVSYMIIDNEDLKYIGITTNINRRLSQHNSANRFKNGIKDVIILREYESYNDAEIDEPLLIEKYDTYHNGLNKSINGKGNHLSPKFTTYGYKFTDKQRKNMRDSHWSRNPDIDKSWLNRKHSQETIDKISKNRKGIVGEAHCKLSLDTRLLIEKQYKEDTLNFDNEFISKHIKTSQIDKIDELDFEELVSKNGKPLKRIVLYKFYFAEKYNMTTKAMENICLGKFVKDRKAYERS